MVLLSVARISSGGRSSEACRGKTDEFVGSCYVEQSDPSPRPWSERFSFSVAGKAQTHSPRALPQKNESPGTPTPDTAGGLHQRPPVWKAHAIHLKRPENDHSRAPYSTSEGPLAFPPF